MPVSLNAGRKLGLTPTASKCTVKHRHPRHSQHTRGRVIYVVVARDRAHRAHHPAEPPNLEVEHERHLHGELLLPRHLSLIDDQRLLEAILKSWAPPPCQVLPLARGPRLMLDHCTPPTTKPPTPPMLPHLLMTCPSVSRFGRRFYIC